MEDIVYLSPTIFLPDGATPRLQANWLATSTCILKFKFNFQILKLIFTKYYPRTLLLMYSELYAKHQKLFVHEHKKHIKTNLCHKVLVEVNSILNSFKIRSCNGLQRIYLKLISTLSKILTFMQCMACGAQIILK